jgi:hypothetical protein
MKTKTFLFLSLLLLCTLPLRAQEETAAGRERTPEPKVGAAWPSNVRTDWKTVDPESVLLISPENLRACHDLLRMYTGQADAFTWMLYNRREVFPGMTVTSEAGGTASFQAGESLAVETGVYALRYLYNFAPRPYNDAVAHLNLSYRFESGLTVGVYGQYALFSVQNARRGSTLPPPFIPRSGYGVTAGKMFNSVFGIQGAAGMERDLSGRRWYPVYGISPVINLNSLFK